MSRENLFNQNGKTEQSLKDFVYLEFWSLELLTLPLTGCWGERWSKEAVQQQKHKNLSIKASHIFYEY